LTFAEAIEHMGDRLLIEPNRVDIIPSNPELHAEGGAFHLRPISQPRGWPDLFTLFLRSLIAHLDGKLIAVIVSGDVGDGAAALCSQVAPWADAPDACRRAERRPVAVAHVPASAGCAAGRRAGCPRDHGDSPSTVRILARRKFAAHICLGASMDGPPTANRAFLPPIQCSRLSTPMAHPQRASISAPRAVTPTRPAQQPSFVNCSVVGCLTSEGSRRTRLGGLLLGPNGL
jgi:hypothetical protein